MKKKRVVVESLGWLTESSIMPKKIAPHDPLSAKNSGVEARALKDKLEMKAIKDGSASYAALEKKAELYERLMRGELSDGEEKERYFVDFFAKRLEEDALQKTQSHDSLKS